MISKVLTHDELIAAISEMKSATASFERNEPAYVTSMVLGDNSINLDDSESVRLYQNYIDALTMFNQSRSRYNFRRSMNPVRSRWRSF